MMVLERLKARYIRFFSAGGAAPRRENSMRFHFAAGAAALAAFVLAFLLLFPVDILKERVETVLRQQTGIPVSVELSGLRLPLGIAARAVTVPLEGMFNPLRFERVRVDAGAGTLWGSPSASFSARFQGGELEGQLSPEGVNLLGGGIGLGGILTDASPARLQGDLSTQVDLALGDGWEGSVRIDVRGLALLGLEGLGLAEKHLIGDLHATAAVEKGVLRLTALESTGGEIELRGQGTVMLQSPDRARLGLQLGFRPTDQMPAAARELLTLSGKRPDRDGFYTVRVSGTIASPQLR